MVLLKVKAIDKAGNERVAQYLPPTPRRIAQLLVIGLTLVTVGVAYWFYRKSKSQDDKR
jgi:hypothetical protein